MTDEIFERVVNRLSFMLWKQREAFDKENVAVANSWGSMIRGFEQAIREYSGEDEADRIINEAEKRAGS